MQVRVRDAKAGPAPLHTPSDLKPNAVRDLSGALNILLADMFGLYLKTKNFHWHMSGLHFRDYHLLLDEQGDQIFATTDAIAERVRKIGGTTLRSIGNIGRLQRVADYAGARRPVVTAWLHGRQRPLRPRPKDFVATSVPCHSFLSTGTRRYQKVRSQLEYIDVIRESQQIDKTHGDARPVTWVTSSRCADRR